jgi:hypothetical protein
MTDLTVKELGHLDGQMGWINASGREDSEVFGTVDQIGKELARWVSRQRDTGRTGPNLLDRSAYQAPDNPYGQMSVAARAVEEDDIVGGVADVTQGLIFQGMKWEGENADDADIFNQISRDLNLDEFIRQWWREEYTYSQCVIGVWWGWKDYKVRGRTSPEETALVRVPGQPHPDDPSKSVPDTFEEPRDPETNRPIRKKRGNKRRKEYHVWCPTQVTTLDPQRVVPIGSGMFGQDRLAWHATKEEVTAWERMVSGEGDFDEVMGRFFLGPYKPGIAEAESLSKMGIDPKRLIELNPDFVFRHCVTKPDYKRFPDIRLRRTFKHLDMKQQLMEADRVMLVGAANYILLIKKGDKDDPADQRELDNLKEGFKVLAKLPVIVSDHRLEVEIVTPDQESVLDAQRYDTIDKRLMDTCLGSLTVTSNGQRNESTLTVARAISRLLESRRLMMKRVLEEKIARAVVDHPLNKSGGKDKFEDEPNLAFTPRNVQLDADSQIVQAVLNLRTQKELSRESTLDFFGFDQEAEAQRREHEEESGLDEVFQTSVPFDSPANQGPFGVMGGRPPGGGKTPQSPAAQTKARTASGNKSSK